MAASKTSMSEEKVKEIILEIVSRRLSKMKDLSFVVAFVTYRDIMEVLGEKHWWREKTETPEQVLAKVEKTVKKTRDFYAKKFPKEQQILDQTKPTRLAIVGNLLKITKAFRDLGWKPHFQWIEIEPAKGVSDWGKEELVFDLSLSKADRKAINQTAEKHDEAYTQQIEGVRQRVKDVISVLREDIYQESRERYKIRLKASKKEYMRQVEASKKLVDQIARDLT